MWWCYLISKSASDSKKVDIQIINDKVAWVSYLIIEPYVSDLKSIGCGYVGNDLILPEWTGRVRLITYPKIIAKSGLRCGQSANWHSLH